MGKSNKKRPASLIKGYLPVRVKLPEPPVGHQDGNDETFFYAKEHREGGGNTTKAGDGNNNNNKGPTTLFVANAPIVPGVKTKLLLKALLGRYGDIDRVTLVDNPRNVATNNKQSLSWWKGSSTSNHRDLTNFSPTAFFLKPIHGSEKFAHIVFTTNQQMRRTLKSLNEMMDGKSIKKGDGNNEKNKNKSTKLAGLELTKLELQMLRDESDRLHREEMGKDDDDDDDDFDDKSNHNKEEHSSTSGILALARRYRSSVARLKDSRQALLDKCNEVMQEYEDTEEAQRLAREAAANQPDEDGFITVVASSKGVEGGKQQLEKDHQGSNRRRNQKRCRNNKKKKESTGASELQDFYRFQRKETRKRTLQDLRSQFEEDLKKVKKMKEEQQYKPF